MKKRVIYLLLLCITLSPLRVFAQGVLAEFNPNVLIPDSVFNDTQTFGGSAGVQKFLESKGSILANTSPLFLVKLNEPTNPLLKQALGDPEYNLDRPRTAAELIWDAAQASGLNPQIILVTLNKEQGLITGNTPANVQRALDHAMGFDCPDSSGCGNLFPGFYYQLFGNCDTAGNRYLGAAKSLYKSFSTPGGRGPMVNGKVAQVGDVIILDNTLGGYDGIAARQTISLTNRATAALYRYTPHVFNGNYNFWKYFTSWFTYPNGTLIKLLGDDTVYILQNGSRQQIPPFVAQARGLKLANATIISVSELSNYQPGPLYGPVDNTIVTLNGTTYVFFDGIKHPVSKFVLSQKKLSVKNALAITNDEALLFPDGSPLPPNDDTVIRGEKGTDIYLVKEGILKLFSPFTFRQYNAAKNVQRIPDTELAGYTADGYVPPLDGTLIKSKSSTNTYIMNRGYRRPLTDELFKNLGFKAKQVVLLQTDKELASIPLGTPPPPKEDTYFSIGTGELYLFKDGAKHGISQFVAKQRKIKPTYVFEAGIATNWPNGIVIPPFDGTLIKNKSALAVYIVSKGQLHPLTRDLFSNLGYSFKNVVTLSDAEVADLPTGGFAPPTSGTYFSVKETHELYLYVDGVKRSISPFVAKQKGITGDYSFPAVVSADWPEGPAVLPRDATLLQGDSSKTLYVVIKGHLVSMTSTVFKRHGYKTKNVKVVPQAEIDRYPKNGALLK